MQATLREKNWYEPKNTDSDRLAGCFHFFQYPSEYLLDRVLIKSVPEIVADRCKMRNWLTDPIPQKPAVCDIHIHVRHRLLQGADSAQMLRRYQ